jgi:anti-sigma-K factor RskA
LFAAATLPPLPATEAYYLWAEPLTGQPHSVGVLSPDPAGRAVLTARRFPGRAAGLAVTVEPAAGAASPAGRRVLAGSR